MLASDKKREIERYNVRGNQLMCSEDFAKPIGVFTVPECLRSPYIFFVEQTKLHIEKMPDTARLLELGSGTGEFTEMLLKTGKSVVASDLSIDSLKFLEARYSGYGNLKTKIADIEQLPFNDNEFDCVISAGVLGFGSWEKVQQEIFRVLKPGGFFIAVDSLNDNPIYRVNRLLRVIFGSRTLSVAKNIPNTSKIECFLTRFESSSVRYFGSFSWALILMRRLVREDYLRNISDKLDKVLAVKKSAFKFVILCQKHM